MAVITTTNVFDFMGTATEQRTTQSTKITNLINNVVVDLEQYWGRVLTKESLSDFYLQDGVNCRICKSEIFLDGKYRDLYTLTAISEEGTALSAIAEYNDGNDYIFDSKRGKIIKPGSYWSLENYAIKITGDIGLVEPSSPTVTLKDIQQLAIEMVAIKSGLWRNITITDDGTIDTIRNTLSDQAKAVLKKYKIGNL